MREDPDEGRGGCWALEMRVFHWVRFVMIGRKEFIWVVHVNVRLIGLMKGIILIGGIVGISIR